MNPTTGPGVDNDSALKEEATIQKIRWHYIDKQFIIYTLYLTICIFPQSNTSA